ncbi:MAG TPA: ABC transporter ATP-binding protein [Bdellovibrionota bacterium]|nr:ABC transporter ATP-binding protein [Bdellovibrionota bacterium]
MMAAQTAVSAVELRGISKFFNGVPANQEIDLQVRAGSIHAIIGENGAGKSTAMKILYGLHRPDAGEILIRGERKMWSTPAQAISAGIGMVHQHFMLAGPYSALENILLGVELGNSSAPLLKAFESLARPVDRKSAKARLDGLADQYGLRKIDWDLPVETLPVGVQQRVEILKLLYQEASILILDEPTAVLTPQEIEELFSNLKKLTKDGKTILIITHKLKEVMSLADEVTVFRAGKVVGRRAVADTKVEELASLMVGRKVNLKIEPPSKPVPRDPVLEISDLHLTTAPGRARRVHPLEKISFSVRGGEVVGIAGVEGNGQSELLQVLLHPRDFSKRNSASVAHATGSVRCLGRVTMNEQTRLRAEEIKLLGVGVIPEDRQREGLLLERSIEENFLLGLQKRSVFSRNGFILRKNLREAALRAIEVYDVRPRAIDLEVEALSGGNQQKLIIAREFECEPKLLIAAQPTRGVDVGAIEFIHRRILDAREKGAGVLLVSSELDEILALADRILVMYAGRIVAQFNRGEVSEQVLGLSMGGAHA